MRKLFTHFIVLQLLALMQNAAAQVAPPADASLNRVSRINKNWLEGGMFYGKTPHQEIHAKRTENTKKFKRSDGLIDILIGGPFHYQDKNKAWQDIDLSIKNQDNGRYAYLNEENKFISRFAQNAKDGVKMEYGKNGIEFGINPSISTLNWTPAVSPTSNVLTNGNIITYKNIYADIDLDYELTTNAILHKLKFNNRNVFSGISSQRTLNIEEEISLPSNTVLVDSLGVIKTNRSTKGLVYAIVNNDTIFTINPSRIWDASFKGDIFNPADENGTISEGFKLIPTSITWLSKSRIKLTAEIPINWLLAANRVFPIVFDPTISIGGTGAFIDYIGFAYRYPWRTNYWQQVSQSIYWQSDIGTAGNITAVAYKQAVNNGMQNTNARIQMKTIASSTFTFPTSFSTTGWTNCDISTTTLPYNTGSGTSNANPVPIWRTLSFNTPFFYDNTQNLVIETRFQNSSWAGGGAWYHYTRSGSVVLTHGTCDCPSAYPTALNNDISYSYITPVIQLTINPVVCNLSVSIAGNTTVTCGQAILLTANASQTGVSYSWTGPNGFTSNSQTINVPNASNTNSGTYSVTVSKAGCTSGSNQQTVTVTGCGGCNLSVAIAGNTSVTCGQAISLTANASQTGVTYAWTGPNGFTSNSQTINVPNASNTNSGTYSVTVSKAGCTSGSNQQTVTVTGCGGCNLSVSLAGNTTVTCGQAISLTANASEAGVSYSWTGPNGFTSNSQTINVPNASNTNSGTYSVTVSKAGCTSGINQQTVTVTGCGGCNLSVAIAGNTSVTCGQAISLTANASQTGVTYAWTGPNGFTSNSQTINVPNASNVNSGTYSVTVSKAGCTSGSSQQTVTVTACSSNNNLVIDYGTNAIVIPPWQRKIDDYEGKVTVIRTGNVNAPWHLEVDVHNSAGTIVEHTIKYPSISISTQSFNTASDVSLSDVSLKDYSKEGKIMAYYAVLDNSVPLIRRKVVGANVNNGLTYIIKSKLDKENIVYFNDITSSENIAIPVKWFPGWTPTKVEIVREGYVAATLSIGIFPGSIQRYQGEQVSNNGFFEINQDGYTIIDKNNSNINNPRLLPGDFKYRVYYANSVGETILDDGVFDLTKIGKISNSNSTNLLVMVGGILNEIESSAEELTDKPTDAVNTNSDKTFSLIEYCRDKLGTSYSTWYIAQGNANSILRNGYDIGIALQKIKKINDQSAGLTSEIDLLCHSKGGLDTRALLTGINQSMNGLRFDLNDSSSLKTVLKKVVFLGSPHRGAPIANVLQTILGNTRNIGQIPGLNDLQNTSVIIDKLKNKPIPPSVSFANLTGYISQWTLSDHVVPLLSSYYPPLSSNSVTQLFQNDTRVFPTGFFHMDIHQNKRLFNHNLNLNGINCTYNTNNLDKIVDFLRGSTSIQSCQIQLSNSLLQIIKSKLSGAYVSFKSQGDSFYNVIGQTDENGCLPFNWIDNISISDTFKISANGVDSILIQGATLVSLGEKIPVAMIKSTETNKIKYPTFSLTNSNVIYDQPIVQYSISGQNVNSFDIKKTSDANFIRVSNFAGNFILTLDTGYNKITVRFAGIDTMYQTKELYYFPDILYSDFSWKVSLNSTNLIGTKIFVNNQYLKEVTSNNDSIRVLKGVSQLKFSKNGYEDKSIIIDTATALNLTMLPLSHSSISDSSIYSFSNGLNPQYWKTVTTKNLSASVNRNISIKQYDDAFIGMALKPQTRKFVYRNLISGSATLLKTAIALDQINTPDSTKVYLLNIKNGNKYYKYKVNTPNLCEYDAEVQKLAFDSLNFKNNAATEELVLMEKQAPIMKTIDTIWHSGQTLVFPIGMFVSDPDSIKNDITASSTDVKVVVNGNLVYVTAPVNFVGTTSFTLTGTHDWLDRKQTYTMKVIPPEVFIPTAFTPNNDRLNDVLKPTFMGKLLYCHFSIYNRYGQKVFETKDCLAGWNGRIKGAEQSTSNFVYTLTYRFEGTKEEEKTVKGTFILIH